MLTRNPTLPDGRSGVDLLVQQGRFAAIGEALPVPPEVEGIDADGRLHSPPFVGAMTGLSCSPAEAADRYRWAPISRRGRRATVY